MAPLTTTGLASINAQNTGDVWAFVVFLSGSSVNLRLTSNFSNVTHGGNVYTPRGMSLRLPDETKDQLGTVDLAVEDTDGAVFDAFKTEHPIANERPTCTITLLDLEEPNQAQYGPTELEIVNVATAPDEAKTVTLIQLQLPNLAKEPYPGTAMRPDNFPGLY